jgi:hypothetical protein
VGEKESAEKLDAYTRNWSLGDTYRVGAQASSFDMRGASQRHKLRTATERTPLNAIVSGWINSGPSFVSQPLAYHIGNMTFDP